MAASRIVVQGDAFSWLAEHQAQPGTSVITSLPDVSELPELDLDGWRSWFMSTAGLLMRWVPEDGVTIFFQSDIRRGSVWIDKGYLVARAAEEQGAALLWHKIVCRKPPGTVALGRPSYSHMLAFSRAPGKRPRRPGPDVVPDAGFMSWSRAMGIEACRVACRYLRDETATTTIVDPFCGRGAVLAVAGELGFDAIGVEISGKRCRAARSARASARA